MISKYFDVESVDKNEIYEIVRIIGSDCKVLDTDDRCDAGYAFTMCLQKIIDDHVEIFNNMIDYDMMFEF